MPQVFLAHKEEVKFFELAMCCDDTNEITGNVFPCVVLSDILFNMVMLWQATSS